MNFSAKALLVAVSFVPFSFGQSGAPSQPPSDKAAAYYNFAMGHLYAELAGVYGNRSDYVIKAIDYYKQALKVDPGASFLFEELTDLYIQSGRLRDAVTEAQDILQREPNNLDARRILGRIYTRMIGDTQQGKINEEMLHSAIEQYQKIVAADPKDTESWLTLGRLYRTSSNSVEAEKAYLKALALDPASEDALTGLAIVYSDIGDTKKAIEKLQAVTSKDPNPRTFAALASAYEQLRDYANAADVLHKALELDPDNVRLKRALARNLLYAGNYDESLKLCNELASEDAHDPEVQLWIAGIYREKRDFAKARAALDKAKAMDPENLEVRYDEVNLLAIQGQNDQAITALQGLLKDTERKTYSGSEKNNRAMFLERLGELYRASNQYPSAVDAYRKIVDLDAPDVPPARGLAEIIDTYRIAKDYKNARAESAAALKKYPNERALKLVDASLLADSGHLDDAVAELQGLLKGDHDRETELAIAQIYERAKRFQDMTKPLDEALKLSQSNAEKETVYFMRGAMYERLKQYDNAEADFRKVLESSPDNAGALNYLGYMFADRGIRLEEAQKLISRALEIDPDNGAYLDSLGWTYYRLNKLDEAQETLVRALAKLGQDPTVHDHMGDVYFKLGRIKDAITQWQASLKAVDDDTQSDLEPDAISKISRKLEDAKVRLAQQTGTAK